jgi:hypothetical protein
VKFLLVLTVAGKADSRVVVYPLAYLLRSFGRVAIVTDDGAYRRLYHGYSDAGEVSGVSVYVSPTMCTGALNTHIQRVAPDFLLYVTNGFVPLGTSHLLVLTGFDKTFDAGNAYNQADLEQGIKVNVADEDLVLPPDGFPIERIKEVVLSTTPVNTGDILSVTLDGALLTYVAKCEEAKKLLTVDSPAYVKFLQALTSPFLLPTVANIAQIFGVVTETKAQAVAGKFKVGKKK